MNDYQVRTIKSLKDTIKLYESLMVESNALYSKNYDAVPYDLKPDELLRHSMFYKAMLTVFEYYAEKVNGADYIMLGKYVGVSMSVFGNDLRFGLYLKDDETESKLYDLIFGSHSGINEFFQDHFLDLFSVVLGNTNYSHAFGSYDLNDAFGFFKHFGYEDREHKRLCWKQEDFDKQIERAKRIIDWFVKLSQNTNLMADVDKVLDTYFEVVFKYNHE